MRDHRRLVILPVCWSLLLLKSVSSIAEAAPTGAPMPWDGPLNTILSSLSGTVAHVLITVAVIVTGLVFAFTEHGSGARRLFGVAPDAARTISTVGVFGEGRYHGHDGWISSRSVVENEVSPEA